MDGWFKARLAQRQQAKHETQIVSDGFHTLWANLCKEIYEVLGEYGKASEDLIATWDGDPPERFSIPTFATITLRKSNRFSFECAVLNTLELSVDYKGHSLAIAYASSFGGRIERTLCVGLSESEKACFLDEDGSGLTVEQAGERILDAFLFPDLAKSTVRKLAAIAS
jgi:hypothetical protein